MSETIELNIVHLVRKNIGSNRVLTQEHFSHSIANEDPRKHTHTSNRLSPSTVNLQIEASENNLVYIKSLPNVNGLTMPFDIRVGGIANDLFTTKSFMYEGDPTTIYIGNASVDEEVLYEVMTVQEALEAPVVSTFTPLDTALVNSLDELEVVFDQHVSGVSAADLLINGTAATSVSGSGDTFTFAFTEPDDGTVNLVMPSGTGIKNVFNKVFVGDSIAVTLDTVIPTLLTRTPASGSTVSTLTQVAIEFSESVTGVNAGDLLINGAPADSVVQAGNLYTFTFVQPASGTITFQVLSGGIEDLAGNSFAGSTWQVTLS